jgi:hypothetical protein
MFRQEIRILTSVFVFFAAASPFSGATEAESAIREGLFFYSSETEKDTRSSLLLTPEQKFHFPKGFTLEFEVKFRTEIQNFGYICRIIADDTLNIDLLSDYYPLSENLLWLVTRQKTSIQFKRDDLTSAMFDDWIKVRLTVDTEANRIRLSLNDREKETSFAQHRLSDFDVIFGSNSNKTFHTTDVPPMTVKNIRFYDENNRPVYHWKLAKHDRNEVRDEYKSAKAAAFNPCWLIDEHAKWNKKKTLTLPGLYYQYAFDAVAERFFIVKNKMLMVYYPQTGQTDIIQDVKGFPYNVQVNQLLYDSARNELISYDFDRDLLSRFNFQTREWSVNDEIRIDPKFSHHGRYYLPDKATVVAFGGYGYHKYNSLLQLYSESGRRWEQIYLSEFIQPRYLGGMGKYDEQTFLYFGGYGNESGGQEEAPCNSYDLYAVDVRKHTVRKLWELNAVDGFFISSNALIPDRERNVFYALAYSNLKYASPIILHEYRTDKPEYRSLADSIPYLFADNKSYCDLYLNASRTTMYALTSQVVGSDTEAVIYSIAYPPLQQKDTEQTAEPTSTPWKYLLLLFLLPPALFAIRRIIKRKPVTTVPADNKDEPFVPDIPPTGTVFVPLPPSSLHLLGEFKVIDKSNINITTALSPTARQLFLMILLATLKDGEGISSAEIQNRLWNGKDEISARNNRNVYIQKVRTFLKNVGNMEIVKADGRWRACYEPAVFCDYAHALACMRSLRTNGFNKPVLLSLLDIASRGMLLPCIHSEWLDEYKAGYSNTLIEMLTYFSKKSEVKTDFELLLKIADVILVHDAAEEYGVKLKCYALHCLKQNRQAMQVFKKFTDDYENLYACKPELSFEQVTKFKL